MRFFLLLLFLHFCLIVHGHPSLGKNKTKDGVVIEYCYNGKVQTLFTFRNYELNGPCIVNSSEGERNYTGYFKNGVKDSIWTYYRHVDDNDSLPWYMCRYVSGKEYLISAWDKYGTQTVFDGHGKWRNGWKNNTVTSYFKGLKNDKEILYNKDVGIDAIKYYKDDILITDTIFSKNKIYSISQWTYSKIPTVDTLRSNMENTNEVFYKEINYDYKILPNGHWIKYFEDDKIIYEGNYKDGKRLGFWKWSYQNGKPRIIADYSKDIWSHYDSFGKITSHFKNEYFSLLTGGSWNLSNSFENSKVVLKKMHDDYEMVLYFGFNDKFSIQINFESPIVVNSYNLSADTLILKIVNTDIVYKEGNFRYHIESASDNEIILKRIN